MIYPLVNIENPPLFHGTIHYFNGDLNHSYVQLPEGIPLSLTVIVVNEINLATHLGPHIATT